MLHLVTSHSFSQSTSRRARKSHHSYNTTTTHVVITMPIQELFGGGITCEIPQGFRDLSTLRQVPDHQECWLADDQRLLVVEILDREEVADTEAAAHFFKDLADFNGGTNDAETDFKSQALPIPIAGLPPDASTWYGSGFQRVKMGNEVDFMGNPRRQEIEWTRVELCVIRLPSAGSGTDLLISLTTPRDANPQGPDATSSTFATVVSSFQIRNWHLFG